MSVLDAALALDLPVFPCRNNKAPTVPGGFKAATADPVGIRDLWQRCPGPLVGVPTGVSGFDVIDIDPRHAGGEWYRDNKSRLPPTRTHRTLSGGLHIFFRHIDGLRNSAGRIAPGVDVRAGGGYIIWWPATGLGFKDYPPEGLPEWPLWLLPSIMSKPVPPPAPYGGRSQLSTPEGLRGVIREVVKAQEGERNALLYWAACRVDDMVTAGLVTRDFGTDLLLSAAGQVRLTHQEAMRTIKSAFDRNRRYG